MRCGENRCEVVFIEVVMECVSPSRASASGLDRSVKGLAGLEVNDR
jgi:hypothetical protein